MTILVNMWFDNPLMLYQTTKSKLKAVADNKCSVTQKLKFVFARVENITGKGEKCCFPAFPSFPTLFSMALKPFSTKSLSWYYVVKS